MSDEPVILEMFGDSDAAQCVDGVCAVPGQAVGDTPAEIETLPGTETAASDHTK